VFVRNELRTAGRRPAVRAMHRTTVIRSAAAIAGTVLVISAALALVVAGVARGQTSAAKTVELSLVAGKTPANGSFNFNGYAKGALTVTVPVGWRVVIHYSNASALRHSLDVIRYAGTQPDSAPPPAFPGASTKDLVDGIGAGKRETVTFVAGKPGTYEFLCGVLGHAQAGMWDRLVVSPTAKTVAVRPAGALTLKTK
jgi:sulfocyanin